MKRKNIIFILAAIILGLIIGSYVINRAEALELTKEYSQVAFLEEIQAHSQILDAWDLDTLNIGLYPEQEEVFRTTLERIKLVQLKIRTNYSFDEIMAANKLVTEALYDVFDITDFRYINWKNSFSAFEDRVLVLNQEAGSKQLAYLERIHSINNMRRRYLEILLLE